MSSYFGGIPPLTAELAEKSTYKLVCTLASSVLIESSSFLKVTRRTVKAWISSNFSGIPLLTAQLAALERLIKGPINLLVLIGSSSFLQVTRTTILSGINFGKIQPWTAELAALDQLNFFLLT